jgi:uncharacterized membrane protein YhhN
VTPEAVLTVITAGLVAVLVWAEWRHSPVRYAAKPLASAGFIAVAVVAGAGDTGYGRWVLVALLLSALGDVALLWRTRPWFLAGLVAFLFAHLAYSVAFGVRGLAIAVLLIAAVPVGVAAVAVVRWVLPSVPAALRRPVIAYALVISAMVVLAFATWGHDAELLIPAAAVAFYLSDLAVARDRFVAPGFVNRAWGLPAYYGAQLAFAWTVG